MSYSAQSKSYKVGPHLNYILLAKMYKYFSKYSEGLRNMEIRARDGKLQDQDLGKQKYS